MSQPLIVSISHKLGRQEAKRRVDSGIGRLRPELGRDAETRRSDRLPRPPIGGRWEGVVGLYGGDHGWRNAEVPAAEECALEQGTYHRAEASAPAPGAMKTTFRRSGPQLLLHQQQDLMLDLRIVQQLQENLFHVLTEFCFLDFVQSPVPIIHTRRRRSLIPAANSPMPNRREAPRRDRAGRYRAG
jgi:hypothetical protein